MRARRTYRILGLTVGICLAFGLFGLDRSAAADNPATTKDQQQVRRERVEKQLQDIQERFDKVRKVESKISLQVLRLKAKAAENVENSGRVEAKFRKGETDKSLVQYRKIYAACAKQLATLEPQFAALERMLKPIQRDLKEQDDTAYAGRVRRLRAAVWRSRRTNLERIADIYESLAAYPQAIAIYTNIGKSLPDFERSDPRELERLKETILKLKEKYEKMKEERKKQKEKNQNNKYKPKN